MPNVCWFLMTLKYTVSYQVSSTVNVYNLDRVVQCCITNNLELNVSKCKNMTYFRKTSSISYDYVVDHEVLQRPVNFTELGVTFGQSPTFNLMLILKQPYHLLFCFSDIR